MPITPEQKEQMRVATKKVLDAALFVYTQALSHDRPHFIQACDDLGLRLDELETLESTLG